MNQLLSRRARARWVVRAVVVACIAGAVHIEQGLAQGTEAQVERTIAQAEAAVQQTPPATPASPAVSQPQEPLEPPDPPDPPEPPDPPDPPAFPPFPQFPGNPVLRIGGDYVLGASDEVREVVVISGNARINGRVARDVVVILGNVELGTGAVISGSLVVIGGRTRIEQGARVERDLQVIGGFVDAPDGFTPGREHVVVGPELFGHRVDAVLPWVTQGLLLGRPLVPGLGWMWTIVAFFFVTYLVINLLLDGPVTASARTLSNRPLTSLGVGLLVLLLSGPVILLLAVSIVGIVVVPFAVCALLLGWVIGKVSVSRSIGASLLGESPGALPNGVPRSRGRAAAAFAIGFAVLCIAYIVPILGLVAWAMTGVIGLGAAALAFASGYRKENPDAARRGAIPVPPRPPAPSPSPAASYFTADSPGGPPVMPVPVPAAAPSAAHPSEYVSHTASASDQPLHAADAVRYSAPAPAGVTTPPADVASAPPPTRPMATASGMLAFPRARFKERLAAFVLDVLLVVIAFNLLDIGGNNGERTFALLLLVYYVGFWTWKGTTVGGIICRLRVIRATGEPLQFGESLIRGLTGILSLAAFGLGALWILFDEERQAWHDRVAGTYVVKVPRDWPL